MLHAGQQRVKGRFTIETKINSLSGLETHGLEDALDLLQGYTVSICTVQCSPQAIP